MEILGYTLDKKFSKFFSNNDKLNNLINNVDAETRTILEKLKQNDIDLVTYVIYKEGEEVGYIEFRDFDIHKPKIGIEIKEKFRRQGIAYNLLRELLKKVSEEYEVEYFVYQVRGENKASINLVNKLGGIFQKKIEVIDTISILIYHIMP